MATVPVPLRTRLPAAPARTLLLAAGLATLVACGSNAMGVDEDPEVFVVVDAGHHNYHTADGRYAPFAELLRDDGFLVGSVRSTFEPDALRGIDVLVIANALHASNVNDWALPTPSAFTEPEIQAVVAWVEAGGGLLLIADHMPFPGAAAALAGAFGVTMSNGFAFDTLRVALPEPCLAPHQIDVFRHADGSLADHPIRAGAAAGQAVDSVATFTGHAFQAPAARPLLRLGAGWISLLPERAWEFDDTTPRADAAGWLQAATIRRGAGRVAVFGEAGLFSEQLCDGDVPHGMNAPAAGQNARLVLNTLHWLAGHLDPD